MKKWTARIAWLVVVVALVGSGEALGTGERKHTEGKYTVEGETRTVVHVDKSGQGLDLQGSIKFGELEEAARKAIEEEQREDYVVDKIYFVRKPGFRESDTPHWMYIWPSGNRATTKMDCGGHTLLNLLEGGIVRGELVPMWLHGDRLWRMIEAFAVKDPQTGKAREFLDEEPKQWDVIFWGPGVQGHVSSIVQVSEDPVAEGKVRMLVETKDGEEAVLHLDAVPSTSQIVSGFPFEGWATLRTYQDKQRNLLASKWGTPARYRFLKEDGITVDWFYWTPSWEKNKTVFSLTGTWEKEGDKTVRYEITERTRHKKWPLVIRSEDKTRTAHGTFKDNELLYRSAWGAGEDDNKPALKAEYTKDRIRWLDPTPAMTRTYIETWIRRGEGFQTGDSSHVVPPQLRSHSENVWDDPARISASMHQKGEELRVTWIIRKYASRGEAMADLAERRAAGEATDAETRRTAERWRRAIKRVPGKMKLYAWDALSDYSREDRVICHTYWKYHERVREHWNLEEHTKIESRELYRDVFVIRIDVRVDDDTDCLAERRKILEKSKRLVDLRFPPEGGGTPGGGTVIAAGPGPATAPPVVVGGGTVARARTGSDPGSPTSPTVAGRPTDAAGWADVGSNQLADSRFADAEGSFREGLALKPTDASLHNLLGKSLAGQGRWGEAEASSAAAVRLAPAEPTYPFQVALNQLMQGKSADAEGSVKRAIALDPSQGDFHNTLSLVYASQSKYADAEAAQARTIELAPENAVYQAGLGYVLYQQRKFAEAEAAYRRAVGMETGNAMYHMGLGDALQAQGKYEDAVRAYRESLRLFPKGAQTRANLAWALLALGRRDEAMVEARQAIQDGCRQHPVYGQLGIQPQQ